VSVFILAAIFGFFALLFIIIGWKLLRQESWLIQWIKGTSGLLCMLLAVFFGLSSYELSKFQLVPEDVVPSLLKASILQQANQSYKVALTSLDPTHSEYDLKGDLWQVNIRTWMWSPSLKYLPLPDLYKVEKISSRYLNIEQEIKSGVTEVLLYKPLVNIWPILDEFSRLNVFNTQSLKLGFVPAVEGSLFSINLVEEALVLEAVNAPATTALKNWQ